MKAQPTPSVGRRHFALDALDAEQPVSLVTVVDHSGSVPGVTRTFVVVTRDGQSGTVGGGETEALARVRAPVGAAISSHTPEEIAVSVAAEIIGIRNGALD